MPFHPGTHGPEYPYAGRSELDENEEVTGLSSFYHLDDDDVFYLEQGDFPSMFDSNEEGKAFVQTIARIPDEEIYPLPSDHLRIATRPGDPQCFIARPRLHRYGPEQRGTTRIANMFLDLVYAHEQLASHPHPNIVKYHGCIIKRGRIIGIVLDRHSISLDAMIFQHPERLITLDPEVIGNGLESGIRHLQSLGVAHNDICPKTITLNEENQPVIVGLQWMCRLNEGLLRAGREGWMDLEGNFGTSDTENDLFAARKMRQLLEDFIRDWREGHVEAVVGEEMAEYVSHDLHYAHTSRSLP